MTIIASRESYAHRFAKQLVIQWLRERARPVCFSTEGDYNLINLDPVRALVPANDPLTGVFEEYPICLTPGGSTTLHKPWTGSTIPSFSELIERQQPPAYILDIAVQHMDSIAFGIEIVHRHPVPPAKINSLRVATYGLPFELYQVSAEWVLNQCHPPSRLEVTRLIPGPRRYLPFGEA